MKTIYYLLLVGMVLALSILPSRVFAAQCTTPYSLILQTPSPAAVDTSRPVGSVLWTGTVNAAPQSGGNCSSGNSFTMNFVGAGPYLGNLIYESGIPGIGYTLRFAGGNFCSLSYWPTQCGPLKWGNGVAAHQLIVQLVKTGTVQPGSLSGVFAKWLVNNNPADIYTTYSWSTPFVISPTHPTCSVSTPDVRVPMGSVPVNSFSGVGSSSPITPPFPIDLACSGGDPGTSVKVYATLTDNTNPGNTSQVLSLTSDSTAQGVGIQVLKNGTVLGYGPDASTPGNTNQWEAGVVNVGTDNFRIPLQARYVQTGPNVTPGIANGRATFTMSYQ